MNDLLQILDMSEKEQWEWIASHKIEYSYDIDPNLTSNLFRKMALADLAFRLRDEAVKENHKNYHNAIYEIQEYLGEDSWATAFWGECFAKPIHWIIAALIAKGQK